MAGMSFAQACPPIYYSLQNVNLQM